MRYFLSRIIPMPFSTAYTVPGDVAELAQWWQWRDHVFAHRISKVGRV